MSAPGVEAASGRLCLGRGGWEDLGSSVAGGRLDTSAVVISPMEEVEGLREGSDT